MMKRIWFPALCALILCGGIWYFFIRSSGQVNPPDTAVQKSLFGDTTQANQNGQVPEQGTTNTQATNINPTAGNVMNGPQLPTSATTNNKLTIMQAEIRTNKGIITIVFNPETPNTVENFIKLAQANFYDGTKFHRVIKGFMNQGGDPLSKDDSMKDRWGTGGPGYQFADEIKPDNHNDAGTMAMANAGPNTNGSQFFFNAVNNNFLDTKHTVFAKVVTGMDVVTTINNAPTDANDRPIDPVIIESITLK